MAEICRVCLNSAASLMDIFGERAEEPSWAEMLNECIECKVKSDDKLPKRICLSCSLDAQTAFKFKRRCEQSYKLLTLKSEEKGTEVDLDDFCDMLVAEEWELPKRVDYIKLDRDESPELENCKPNTENIAQIKKPINTPKNIKNLEQESNENGESFSQNNSSSTESSSNRYPKRRSTPKSYVEHCKESEAEWRSNSDWSEELSDSDETECKTKPKPTKPLERKFKCLECPKSFARHKTLQAHSRTHTGERPYQCPECPKVFAQSHHIRDHMDTHSGHRPHKCPQCPKAFSQKSNLSAHIHTHSDDRPYKCTHCSKTFVRNYDLQAHLRVHTGDRPYKCKNCSKAFNRCRDLVRHKRVHTGEQPFKCPQCSLKFSRNDQMKIHLRDHQEGVIIERKKRRSKATKVATDKNE